MSSSTGLRAALLAAAFLAAVGCASYKTPLVAECKAPSLWKRTARPGPALIGVSYGMQATPIPLDSIQFSSDRAAGLLAVQQIGASRTDTGTVKVDARFVSCSDRPQSIRVRTTFLGEGQAQIEPVSAWKIVFLEPHLTASYLELSTSRKVANYVIEIAAN